MRKISVVLMVAVVLLLALFVECPVVDFKMQRTKAMIGAPEEVACIFARGRARRQGRRQARADARAGYLFGC